ncbi:MAG: 50S ribosomal protein L25 [Lentisphaeria bacterium]|nr:50S ribosomal protein L25 [Lentisphaeria bacterium]
MSKETHKIQVEERTVFGNNASRRLRNAGRIPAVIYGNGKAPRAISVDSDAWCAFTASHASQMVTLVEAGKEVPALIKEVQYNHLKNYFVHIDFQEVNLDREISASVPLHAHGECYGATHGGILEQDLHELPVLCRPKDLPESIRVDVTELKIGDGLTVGQLTLPAGVKADIADDTLVFHVVRPQEEVAAEPTEEAAATEPEAINEKKTEARAAEKESKEKERK